MLDSADPFGADGIEDHALEVVTTCREMLTLAATGEWPRVLELDVRRGRELSSYLGTPDLTSSDVHVRRQTLETIIELNQALVEEAQVAQKEVGRELKRIQASSNAARAYDLGRFGETS